MSQRELNLLLGVWLPEWRKSAFEVCGDWHLADDAVQDAVVQLLRDGRGDALKLLAEGYLLVTRCALEQLRQVQNGPEHLTADVPDMVAMDAVLPMTDLVPKQLQNLPVRLRSVVTCRFQRDLSVSETARELGMSESTVKSATRRALRLMRATHYARHQQKRSQGPGLNSRGASI